MDLAQLRSPEFRYLLLVVGLFLVPRILQRYKLPSAVTCVFIGAVAGMGFGALHGDHTVELLGVLGIVALFLFAGMEVDLGELRRGAVTIVVHLLVQTLLLVLVAGLVWYFMYLEIRASILYALAIVTPSTGFILDSLHAFGLNAEQRLSVKSKAIAAELLALGILFVAIQSQSQVQLLISASILIVMIWALPRLFRAFARTVLPHAPNSEFAFVVIVALVCAVITRQLGVYYLVGAFIVGITARQLGEKLPAVASRDLLRSIELFASFFIPFYFFKAGLKLTKDDFTWRSIALGLLLFVTAVPVRVTSVSLRQVMRLKRPNRDTARVGISMIPTLVFALVIGNILRERFGLPPALYGALVVYALVTTIVPGIVLGATPEYDKPMSIYPPPSETSLVTSVTLRADGSGSAPESPKVDADGGR